MKFPRDFYRVTGVAIMIFISSTLSAQVIEPFFPLYLVEKECTPLELGLIVSLLSITTLVVRLPLGLLIDRVGSWWVVPLSLAGQSTAYILYALATCPAHFYPIRIYHAIVVASLNPTLISLVSSISPKGRKGEAMGAYLTSVGLTMTCGALLSSALLKYLDYMSIILASSTIPCFALGLSFSAKEVRSW